MFGKRKDSGSDDDITVLLTLTSTYTISDSTSRDRTTKQVTKTATVRNSEHTEDSSSVSKARLLVYDSTTISEDQSSKITSDADSSLYESQISSHSKRKHTSKTASSKIAEATATKMESVVSNKDSNKSLKLGLAIGIPISVVVILAIIGVLFIYLKKNTYRKRKEKIISYNDQFYNEKNISHPKVGEYPIGLAKSRSLSDSKKPSMSDYSEDSLSIKPGPERRMPRQSLMFYVKDRLSKVINTKYDYEAEHANGVVKSPVNLRKFHLTKESHKSSRLGDEPSRSRKHELAAEVEPQFLSFPYNHSKTTLEKPSKSVKPHPRLPLTTDSSNYPSSSKSTSTLDPIRGSGYKNYDVYLVVKNYRKNLRDELDISLGDRVCMLKEHSDGWCKVRIIREGQDYYLNSKSCDEGVVPKLCLRKIG